MRFIGEISCISNNLKHSEDQMKTFNMLSAEGTNWPQIAPRESPGARDHHFHRIWRMIVFRVTQFSHYFWKILILLQFSPIRINTPTEHSFFLNSIGLCVRRRGRKDGSKWSEFCDDQTQPCWRDHGLCLGNTISQGRATVRRHCRSGLRLCLATCRLKR